MRRMKPLKIGMTVSSTLTNAQSALWSSGINQNNVFLALLLQRLPEVELCWLISYPDPQGAHPFGVLYGLPTWTLADAIEQLDVIIEIGVRTDADSMNRFRDRGGRLVSYMAGNTMAMNFEAVASNVDHGEFISEAPFDAVWITPQHWRMNHAYAVLTRSAHVERVPHIWHPLCLTQSIFEHVAESFFWKDTPMEQGWRIGIFDPNINILKTFHLPVLVCEEAYRRQPNLIRQVSMFSANHLMGNIHFEEFCAATELYRAKKLFAEPRYALAQVMGLHVDAVVTHQWENELNYLYWDTLYSGRPLIHNSPSARDVGGYYESFDPQDGGRVLVDALAEHGARARAYRPRVLEFLWSFEIDNPAVQARHVDLLESLMDQPA
jgi:hypothetical protein